MTQPYHRGSSLGHIFVVLLGALAAGIVGLILLCAGGGLLLLWGAERGLAGLQGRIATAERESELESAHAAVAAFLEGLRTADDKGTYGHCSKGFQQRQSLIEWQALLNTHRELRAMHIADVELTIIASPSPSTCRAILLTAENGQVSAVADMIKEDGSWVIDRLTVP